MSERGSAARHTFYYLLGLVTLGFTAIGIGQILFSIINALFPENTYLYDAAFDEELLRFGITAVIISAPIFFICTRAINRELAKGSLDLHSLVRKWLTYLILLIVSVTIIGDLMVVLYNFLSGELTTKFILKALVILGITAFIFTYYQYDITRSSFKVDQKLKNFRHLFIGVVGATVIAGFFFNATPGTVRAEREDNERVNRMRTISFQVQQYYEEEKALPKSLELIQDRLYEGDITDPVTDEVFPYEILEDQKYQICATFAFSNRKRDESRNRYYRDPDWLHDAGEQCFERTVESRELREVPFPPRA